MDDDGISRSLVREAHGFAGLYGPFVLRSAFQPIFRQNPDGRLHLEAFEGLVRPLKAGESCSPMALFAAVPVEDRGFVDALCRRLHMTNMAELHRRDATLFLNFDPSLFDHAAAMEAEANRIATLAARIGLTPRQIVCEITEKKAKNRASLVAVTEGFRQRGFRVAVDDYGAEESDISRIELLNPDIVKFDGEWVMRYMEHPAGIDLLREMTARFHARRITTLFEGLEHAWQVDLCETLKVDLLQGYALARPEMLPTRFNAMFPEAVSPHMPVRPSSPSVERALEAQPQPPQPRDTGRDVAAPAPAASPPAPARRPFGRRGL